MFGQLYVYRLFFHQAHVAVCKGSHTSTGTCASSSHSLKNPCLV